MSLESVAPTAFLSYSHFDNDHDDGLICELAERIGAEVRAQSGVPFDIFVDRKDIKWGESWKRRLEDSLDGSTFFFPVITPSYFLSDYCMFEAERFIWHEKRLGRSDLIFPIYYIDLANSVGSTTGTDNVREALFQHQHIDWRELRFELLTAPAIRKRIATLAREICSTIKATSGTRVEAAWPAEVNTKSTSTYPTTIDKEELSSNVESNITRSIGELSLDSDVTHFALDRNIDPIIVDGNDPDAAFRDISSAIDIATPGSRIVVRPGVYYEEIIINKPIELIGSSPRGGPKDVCIDGSGTETLRIDADFCRVTNLSFRHSGNGNPKQDLGAGGAAVITRGKAVIEN